MRVLSEISPEKDVDGLHPANVGDLALRGRNPRFVACTPRVRAGSRGVCATLGRLPRSLAWPGRRLRLSASRSNPPAPPLFVDSQGCIELLHRNGIEISGKSAVVLGRSNIVGIPAALLLLQENATVTVCHSRTKDIEARIRDADILVAAIGKAHFVQGSWIKPGAVVIDVGINSVGESRSECLAAAVWPRVQDLARAAAVGWLRHSTLPVVSVLSAPSQTTPQRSEDTASSATLTTRRPSRWLRRSPLSRAGWDP